MYTLDGLYLTLATSNATGGGSGVCVAGSPQRVRGDAQHAAFL